MNVNDLLGVLQRQIVRIKAVEDRVPPAPVWGTVTAVAPLLVRPDGPGSVEVFADNIAGPLKVGARVLIQMSGLKPRVIGPPSNVAQYDTDDVNGNYMQVGGGPDEPSYRLHRLFGATKHALNLYLPNAPENVEAGLLLSKDGLNRSRLYFNQAGQVAVNTYTDSPTPAASRPLPFATASGSVLVTPVANTVVATAITFPAGRFTKPPEIMVSVNTTVPHICNASYSSISSTGFTLNFYRTNTNATTVSWLAVQMEV